MAQPERLQKFMAECGIASRRACEEIITAGRVKVGGRPAALGMKIDPDKDLVTVDGRRIEKPRGEFTYIMLNKPRGYITTMDDELSRKCVKELIPEISDRVVPVGRLDRDSEGLLLLTNDGELVFRLTHPSHEVEKIYTAVVRGRVSAEKLDMLCSPMEIDGYLTAPAEVSVLEVKEDRTSLRVVLREGRNRQIRKMCEKAALEVLRLKRVAVGKLRLAEVKSGKWRNLLPEEVEYLKSL